MPTRDEIGRPRWPKGDIRPHVRTYTVRRYDAATGEIDVDFILHDHGPAGRWAMSAEPGSKIDVGGVGGLSVREADWYLFTGDEMTIPALSRTMPALEPVKQGVAFIEVGNSEDELPIETASGVSIRYLQRGDVAPGQSSLLLDAVKAIDLPDGSSIFAWLGGESLSVRAIRTHLTEDRGLPREQILSIGYWKAGLNEDEYHDQFNNDREAADMFGRHTKHGHEEDDEED